MTAIDQHIIQLLDTLSEEGKEAARKMLGKSKRRRKQTGFNDIQLNMLNTILKKKN